MSFSPDFDAFARVYDSGKPQLVSTKLVADLETPVSAYLKLADGRANSFLLESVEGGSVRGRYSIIGFKPDVIWRCRKGQAEINRRARSDVQAFETLDGRPLETLRQLVRECQMDLPPGLPPMASGLFGFLGYDMVRDMERLPDKNPDPIGLPDAIMVRPTIICIFDRLEDNVTLVTPAWPDCRHQSRAPPTRLRRSGWPTRCRISSARCPSAATAPASSTSCPSRRPTCRRKTSRRWSRPARSTSARATPSRSCPRSASRCPSSCRHCRSTARCAASTPRRS